MKIIGFWRFRPSQNRSGMRLRTEMAQEIDENRVRRHLGERFFRSGPVFGRFLDPTWVPDWPLCADFRPTFVTFWRTVGWHVFFLCSRVLGEAPGIDLGCPGEPPGKDFARILDSSLRHVGRSWPSIFVQISSQVRPNSASVVVLPSVSHPCCPALQLQGRWSRAARWINHNLDIKIDIWSL